MSNLPDEKKLDEWARRLGATHEDCASESDGCLQGVIAAFLRSPELRQAMRTQELWENSRFHYCLAYGVAIPPLRRGSYSGSYEAHNNCHESKHVDVMPCMEER